MYYHYFGLKEAPFSIAVDPHYLFMSARHRDALAHLLYGVGGSKKNGASNSGGGFILLTGPVGTGKTTLTRSLLSQLPENTQVALILNPTLSAIELLATACDELGISYNKEQPQLKQLTDQLHKQLLDNFAKGINTVLLIDEAQHLQFETLEQIRLLTNLETNTQKLLQIILVGQPELKQRLQHPELSQLAQRITARYNLTALNLEETYTYIYHRLHIAGLPSSQKPFPKLIIKQIYKASGGVPRLINLLCDRMLLGCYGKQKNVVDKTIAKSAISEIAGDDEFSLKTSSLNVKTSINILSLSLVIITAVYFSQHISRQWLENKNSTTATTHEHKPPIIEKESSNYFSSQTAALSALAQQLNLEAKDNYCDLADYRCEQLNIESWQALDHYPTPLLLKLIDDARFARFALLLDKQPTEAIIFSPLANQRQQKITLTELGKHWTGDIILLWQPPPGYNGPLTLGDNNDSVIWLVETFSKLDEQDTLLSQGEFNQALQQRVILFQQQEGLVADGVVGLKTLLALKHRARQYSENR